MTGRFYVGTYTEPILFGTGEVFPGKGKGVYTCQLTGEGKIETLACAPARNPSYLCLNPQREKLYAVNELKELDGAFGGGLFCLTPEGASASLPTGGTDPCHVALAPNGRFLSVANFASGSVTVFPLRADGSLTGEHTLFQHEGSSIHPLRQKGPHAHSTIFVPGKNRMLVPDLGIDTLKAYTYDGAAVTPAPQFDLRVPAGSGPRYGEFSRDGRFLYLINEISSQVMVFLCEDDTYRLLQTVSTLPADFDCSSNICSDLHLTPNGSYLYASNRGHDSLCCFRILPDGSLCLLQRIPCGGKTPRNFAIDPSGAWLLAGNQDSDNITVFSIAENGSLLRHGWVHFPSPVCICFESNC